MIIKLEISVDNSKDGFHYDFEDLKKHLLGDKLFGVIADVERLLYSINRADKHEALKENTIHHFEGVKFLVKKEEKFISLEDLRAFLKDAKEEATSIGEF
jgi:hypothetical protein